jgi:hypothetical protein
LAGGAGAGGAVVLCLQRDAVAFLLPGGLGGTLFRLGQRAANAAEPSAAVTALARSAADTLFRIDISLTPVVVGSRAVRWGVGLARKAA